MSLTHLFNSHFFIQNLKKSKAMIIFISLLLPVFSMLVLNVIKTNSEYAVEFYELGLFNILFMYVIPVVLSIQLFNYVFKEKKLWFCRLDAFI